MRKTKRIYAVILIICFIIGIIPQPYKKKIEKVKAAESYAELNLANGDITIEKNGYWQTDEFIYFKGKYLIYSQDSKAIQNHFIKVVGDSNYDITIRDIKIDFSSTNPEVKDKIPFEIQNKALVSLILEGENQFKSGTNTAALQVGEEACLTIEGTGSLEASSTGDSAAIGGAAGRSGGKITINGGTIKVDSKNGAGIGSGANSSLVSTITINGGTIQGALLTGNGERTGALIGGGNQSCGGTILINGGTIDSGIVSSIENTYSGAVIGGGKNGNSGNILIKGGNIRLRSLGAYSKEYGYGKQGTTAKFSEVGEYMGFTVLRTSYYLANTFLAGCGANRQGAGIGSGAFADVDSIVIQGGEIEAISESYVESISASGSIAAKDKLVSENINTFSDSASHTSTLSSIENSWWCSKGAFIGSGVNGNVNTIKVQGGIIRCKNTFLNKNKEYYINYKKVIDKYEKDGNSIDGISYYIYDSWKDENKEISIYAQRLVWDEGSSTAKATGKFADLISAPVLDFNVEMKKEINECNAVYNQGILNKAAVIGCGYSDSDQQSIRNLEITGGTIYSAFGIVGAACAKEENCEITRYGGQILNDSNDYIPSQIVPSAKEQESLYQVAVVIPEIRNRKNVEVIFPYNLFSQTDENGKLYLWCKEGEQDIAVKVNYKRYQGKINVTKNYNEVILQMFGTCNLSEESINIYKDYYSLTNSQKEIPYNETYYITGKTSLHSVNVLEGVHTIEYGEVESTKTNGLVVKGNSDVTLLFSKHVSLSGASENESAIFVEEGSILRILNADDIFISKIKGEGKVLDEKGEEIYLTLIQTQYPDQDILLTIDGIERIEHTNKDGNISKFLSQGEHQIEISKDNVSYIGKVLVEKRQTNIIFTDMFDLTLKIEEGNIDFSSEKIGETLITTITQDGKSIEHIGEITIIGSSNVSSNQITFSKGETKVILKDIKINSELSPISIFPEAAAFLTIDGIVELTNTQESAAIYVPYGASCYITGALLICQGGRGAAGIGGNQGETCGNITLKDVEGSIKGGEGANDLGNGADTDVSDAAGNIIIEGGKVDLDKVNEGVTNEEGNQISKHKIYLKFGSDFDSNILKGQEIKIDFTGTKQQWSIVLLDRYLSFSSFVSENIDTIYLIYQDKMYEGNYKIKDKENGEIINLNLVLPQITAQTEGEIVAAYHNSITLTVAANASLAANTLSYQWFLNGEILEGAQEGSYIIAEAESTHAGTYYCEITESNGAKIKSNDIILYVGQTKQTIEGPQSYNAKVKDNTISLTNTAKTKITYSILDNPDNAFSLDESSNILTIYGPGKGIIVAQAEETNQYYSEKIQIPIIINKNEAPDIYVKDINTIYDKTEKIPEVKVENGLTYSIMYKKQNEPDNTYSNEAPICAGTYLAKIAVEEKDYEKAEKIAAVIINKRPVNLPEFIVIPKQYDGTKIAKLKIAEQSKLQNVIEEDRVSVKIPVNNEYTDCNVGSKILVKIGTLVLEGEDSENYEILEQIKDLYGEILPANLTISADNLEQKIGEGKKVLTYTITGFQNGETKETLKRYNFEEPLLQCNIDTKKAGEYPIVILGKSLVGNYKIVYRNGTYIVKEKIDSNQGSNQGQGNNQNQGSNQGQGNNQNQGAGGNENLSTTQKPLPTEKPDKIEEPVKTENPKPSDNPIIGTKEDIEIEEIHSVLKLDGNYKGSGYKIAIWYTKTGILKSKTGYVLSHTNKEQSVWKRKLNIFKNAKTEEIKDYYFYRKDEKTGEVERYFIKKAVIDKTAPAVSIFSNVPQIKESTKKNDYKTYINYNVILKLQTDYGLSKKKGAYYQLVEKGKKLKKAAWKPFNEKKLKIKKNFKGEVYFKHIDNAGNKTITKTTGFVIDKRKPAVIGVKNNQIYEKPVKITYLDKLSGVKEAFLNNQKIKNGKRIFKEGNYILQVVDRANNIVKIQFQIKK